MNTLSSIPAAAADRLLEKGWLYGNWTDDDGHECLHQAVRMCAPQMGDGYVVSAWLTANGYPTGWNDTKGRTEDDVLYLLKGLDLTDEALEETFGPNWRAFVALMRLVAVLTPEQAIGLGAAAWDAAGAAARAAAWAVVTRDIIGLAGYAKEHYDLLVAPMVAVFGDGWDVLN